jgi:hypothetical protein
MPLCGKGQRFAAFSTTASLQLHRCYCVTGYTTPAAVAHWRPDPPHSNPTRRQQKSRAAYGALGFFVERAAKGLALKRL